MVWHGRTCLSIACVPDLTVQMVELFGSVRDDWIAADLQGWLAPNRIYDGVSSAVAASMARGDEVYIVTTKQVSERVWQRIMAAAFISHFDLSHGQTREEMPLRFLYCKQWCKRSACLVHLGASVRACLRSVFLRLLMIAAGQQPSINTALLDLTPHRTP
jgi:hypothetical protein